MALVPKKLVFLVFCILSLQGFSQSYNVKIMTWNLLNYPSSTNITGDTTERNPHYRDVVHYVNPDILVTQENATSGSYAMFFNNVMNNGTSLYSAGTFINGYDTDNAIYYLTSLFHFISNTPIHTALRDINEFKLVHLLTNDTLRIYSCHLKAGSGPPNDALRNAEADSLRKHTNALPAGTDFIMCGDFNTYSDTEACYVTLLHDNLMDDGNFVDPINLTGVWNYYPYRSYHTQSTRTRSFGNGSTGGMDDRFDLIIFSNAINTPGGIEYVPGSQKPIGNDGNHFNDSINQQPNTAVPVYLANALHYSSDHLPVVANFLFSSTTGIESQQNSITSWNIYPNPGNGQFTISYNLNRTAFVDVQIIDITGKMIKQICHQQQSVGHFEIKNTLPEALMPGIYFIRILADQYSENKKLIILN